MSFGSSAFFSNTNQLYFGEAVSLVELMVPKLYFTSKSKGDIEIQGGQINIGNIETGLTITGTYAGFTTSRLHYSQVVLRN